MPGAWILCAGIPRWRCILMATRLALGSSCLPGMPRSGPLNLLLINIRSIWRNIVTGRPASLARRNSLLRRIRSRCASLPSRCQAHLYKICVPETGKELSTERDIPENARAQVDPWRENVNWATDVPGDGYPRRHLLTTAVGVE